MSNRRMRDLPARLEGLRRRFDRWRRKRKGRSRIPETLWTAAVKAADKYGLNPTVRALRLDYYALKKRVEVVGNMPDGDDSTPIRSRPSAAQPRGESRVATFVELPPPMGGIARECILELEDPGGAKMRVHLKGVESPDLAALSRSFWSMEVRHGESRRRRA